MWHNGDQTKFKSDETKSTGEAISRADLFRGPSWRDGNKIHIWNNTIQYSGAAIRKVPIPVFRCVFCESNTGNYIFFTVTSSSPLPHGSHQNTSHSMFYLTQTGAPKSSQSDGIGEFLVRNQMTVYVRVHSGFRVLKYFCFLHIFLLFTSQSGYK